MGACGAPKPTVSPSRSDATLVGSSDAAAFESKTETIQSKEEKTQKLDGSQPGGTEKEESDVTIDGESEEVGSTVFVEDDEPLVPVVISGAFLTCGGTGGNNEKTGVSCSYFAEQPMSLGLVSAPINLYDPKPLQIPSVITKFIAEVKLSKGDKDITLDFEIDADKMQETANKAIDFIIEHRDIFEYIDISIKLSPFGPKSKSLDGEGIYLSVSSSNLDSGNKTYPGTIPDPVMGPTGDFAVLDVAPEGGVDSLISQNVDLSKPIMPSLSNLSATE